VVAVGTNGLAMLGVMLWQVGSYTLAVGYEMAW